MKKKYLLIVVLLLALQCPTIMVGAADIKDNSFDNSSTVVEQQSKDYRTTVEEVSKEEPLNIAEEVRGEGSSKGWVAPLLRWYDKNMNYATVGVLMTVESSFIPFPSEVVIPPAVYVASNEESAGGMKIWIIVLVGTIGALLGALINYFLSLWLGRPIIYAFAKSRLGRLLGLSAEKMERAENYFNEHGVVSTLVGRLIPVIRQLISIPAGLSRMNLWSFMLFTFCGALIWNVILALLGYLAYQVADISVIEKYSNALSYIIVIVVVLFIAIHIVRKQIKKRKQANLNLQK